MSILTVKVEGVSNKMKTQLTAKEHQFTIDEPENFGGTNQGPDPLSILLGALASCENVIANFVAKEINFDLQGIEYEVTGELDLRGLMGDSSVRTYFQWVKIEAKLQTSESDERIEEIRKLTDARCPVFQTLKAAGVEIISNWSKA
ncbi:OsmC family protein [Bacillaceae bacterium IKA-2]|nr:OsmC family protein [Bacillaceae bacterium IKA-2]